MPWIKELKIAVGKEDERRVPVRWNVETLRGLYLLFIQAPWL